MFSMDFIRRNMKPIMAALTLMAMITFVFDDAMRSGASYLIPLIFALLFGGAGFVWGTRRGKQNEDLVVGAVLGLVLGLVLITFGQRGTEAEKKVAGLGPRELGQLKQQRELANRIVVALYQKSHPIPKDVLERGGFAVQFYQFQMNQALQQLQFGFARGDADQEAVFTHLLRQEAKRLGVTVSDDAISDFIRSISEQKLSTQGFREVCSDLHINDLVIYEILRDELAARMAAELTFPRRPVTPEQMWQDFRKVNVLHTIEAVTIPVEPFVAGMSEPSDSELRRFFEEHKEKYPGSRGEPGFRQPLKVRLAYLEADFEKIEAEVEKSKNPTDEEVAKYYEDNKDFYIEKPKPKETPKTEDDSPDDAKEDAKKDDAGEKKESDKQESDKKDDKPTVDKPKEDDSDKKPDAEKKPEPEKKSDADTQKSNDGDQPKDANKPEDKKDDKSKSDSSGAAGDDKVTAEKADEAKKDPETKPAEPKDESKDKPSATEEPMDKPAESKDKPATEKPADTKEPESKKTEDGKEADPLKLPALGESPEKRPEPKYQPLEEVQDTIREQLLRDRTLEEIQKRISIAIGQMRKLGSQTIGDKTAKNYRSPQQVADEVRELGKKHDLNYVETGLLTAQELFDQSETGIGRAVHPTSGGQGRSSVIDAVFRAGDDNTHTPEIAQDPGTSNQFAYWVVERLAAHVPEFTEAGVKEQVVKAWKLHQAAPKAESRAKELAKLAVEQKSPLKDVLAGQTLLGDKESQALTAISPPEFSIFTLEGTAPQLNPLNMQQQRPQLSQIAGVENVDFDVMKAIDRIAVGGTDVIPNSDRSGYLVIHVAKRQEISADEDSPQRQDFMDRWPNGTAAQTLTSVAFAPLQQEWVESIERRYNVVWPVK